MTDLTFALSSYVDIDALNAFTVAVTNLTVAVKAAKMGEVGRCLSLARTHAETAELWLQAAERCADAEVQKMARIDGT